MAVDKLVDSTQLDTDLTSVANAIRTKGGTSASLVFPSGFVSAVQAIPTGGGTEVPSGTKSSWNLAELFWALNNSTYTTGTVTVASYYPTAQESEFCDTGLPGVVGGILIFDMAETGADYNYKNIAECCGFFLINNSTTVNQTETSRGFWKTGTTQGTKLFGSTMTSYRVNNGKLYIKPKYTSPSSGVDLVPNHTYKWIAWRGYQA